MDREQKTICEFLTDYYSAREVVQAPRAFATSLVRQLSDAGKSTNAIRQIARACREAAAWDKPWPRQAREVLDLLECYGHREHKPSVSQDIAEEDDMPEEEAELWKRYMKGWEQSVATVQREAPAALETLDASQADGSLSLSDLLDSYPRRGRSPYEK